MTERFLAFIRSAPEFYSALFDDLREARETIQIQIYCIERGGVAEDFKSILIERAAAGVKVDLVYDSVGCIGMPFYFFKELSEAGVNVIEYHPINPGRIKGPFSLRKLFRRNHRKIFLIDSHIYYLGGINLGERFIDWEDIMVRGEGGPAHDLKDSFTGVLGGRTPRLPLLIRPSESPVQVCDCRPMRRNYPIKRLYISSIKKSRKRVWIAQAYFIPRRKLVKALIRAVLRGVDVRVVIPDVSDVRIVDLATWPSVKRLLRHGVKVGRFMDGMLHTKMALIEDNWLTVGTANLDSMSFYWNLETNLVIRDPHLVKKAAQVFADYEARSRVMGKEEPDERPLFLRALGKALYYYSWIL